MMKASLISIFVALSLGTTASAYDPVKPDLTANQMPGDLKGVGFEQHLGKNIDLDNTFFDEEGNAVPLRRFFDGRRPVLLTLVYYSCPSLCGLHLNAVKD